MSNFVNSVGVIAYAKKHCPKYDPKKILFLSKDGYKFSFVIIDNTGGLKRIEFYTHKSSLEILIPRINDYLDGKGWDESVYYQPYTSVPGQVNVTKNAGPVIAFRNEGDFSNKLNEVRNKLGGPDFGFKEVPRPSSFITVTEFLS